MILTFFIFLTIVLFLLALFFGLELLKKFAFMRDFIKSTNQVVSWHCLGSQGKKSQMCNIVLRGEKPFCALVGFKLDIPIIKYSGFDHFSCVTSDENGTAVISGWIGKSAFELQLFVNIDVAMNPITVTSNDEDQDLHPHVVCSPHWWQRIGFYG